MNKLLILFFSFCVSAANAQKKVVVQIDTINFDGKHDFFRVEVTDGSRRLYKDYDTAAILTRTEFPNYKVVLTLKSDSAAIRIPLDTNGGYLEILGAYFLEGGSIRIGKLQMDNCPSRDSTVRIKEYYRVIDGKKIFPAYKVKKRTKVEKENKCIKDQAAEIVVFINGKHYLVEFFKEASPRRVFHGHGYKPRDFLYRTKQKKRAKFLHLSSTTYSLVRVGQIKIVK